MFLTPLEGLVAATLYIPDVTGYPHSKEILEMKATGAHADEYSWVIAEVLRRRQLDWRPKKVVVIPSSELSSPRAGIEMFARRVAGRLGAEFTGGLRFIRPVQSQHKAESREARYSNLAGSMEMGTGLAGQSVMIIDDVATSLATLLEASRAVSASGAKRVSAAVAGRVCRLDDLADMGVLRRDG